jgi:hypothetical protein
MMIVLIARFELRTDFANMAAVSDSSNGSGPIFDSHSANRLGDINATVPSLRTSRHRNNRPSARKN